MEPVKRNRILFVIARGDAFGGSSLHVMDMASRLTADGHSVKILVGGNKDMEVPRRFAERDLNFTCLPELGRAVHPLKDLKAALTIRRETKRFQPDLVSLHSSKAGAVGRLGLIGLGLPQLYTPHCWSFVDGFPNANVYRLLEALLAPLSTHIIAVSEDERRFGLSKGVGKEDQVITIHNGVKDPGAPETTESRGSDSPVRLVMVGRFEAQKNQALLIRALEKLSDTPWQITFVGEGPLLEECSELAHDLGIQDQINFAGYSNRVEEALKEHDLFALISNWEGFPRSILEAMSLGMPVIASDVGGCRESVNDRVTGRIVPPNDTEALTTALSELFRDPEKLREMGQAGRKRFENEFCFETMYGNYIRLYQRLILEADEPAHSASSNEVHTRLPSPAEGSLQDS